MLLALVVFLFVTGADRGRVSRSRCRRPAGHDLEQRLRRGLDAVPAPPMPSAADATVLKRAARRADAGPRSARRGDRGRIADSRV